MADEEVCDMLKLKILYFFSNKDGDTFNFFLRKNLSESLKLFLQRFCSISPRQMLYPGFSKKANINFVRSNQVRMANK